MKFNVKAFGFSIDNAKFLAKASNTAYSDFTDPDVINTIKSWGFDESKINTNKLAPYHRLDLSLDIAGKKNDERRWKSFWNFSIYNAYFRKNPLGVFYFIPNYEEEIPVQTLNPGFFYLYQFVPSVSYRFEF